MPFNHSFGSRIFDLAEMDTSGAHAANRSMPTSPSAANADLQAKVERQSLLIQTLIMILLEKKVIFEDEFLEWMKYVDGLDGSVDGKLKESREPKTCPSCKRNNPYHATKCQYCMTELPQDFMVRRPTQDNDAQ